MGISEILKSLLINQPIIALIAIVFFFNLVTYSILEVLKWLVKKIVRKRAKVKSNSQQVQIKPRRITTNPTPFLQQAEVSSPKPVEPNSIEPVDKPQEKKFAWVKNAEGILELR